MKNNNKQIPDHIHLYQHDIPSGLDLGKIVAIDAETMGLNHDRDRLCLIQLSKGDGQVILSSLYPNGLVVKGSIPAPI